MIHLHEGPEGVRSMAMGVECGGGGVCVCECLKGTVSVL